jgi:hypothetical protein
MMKDPMPASVDSGSEWWKMLSAGCVCATVAFALGCAGDSDSASPIDAIVGGWSNEAAQLFACITDDRRMWIGDSATELDGPNPCTVDDAGAGFHCSSPETESAFDGTIDVSSNQLTIDIVPCPTDPAECHATYVRDSSLTCD